MSKKGKKYVEAAKQIEAGKLYSIEEAIELVKKTTTAKFDASVDLVFKLNLDTRHADQQLRGANVLPNVKQREFVLSLKVQRLKKLETLVLT